MHMCFVCYKCEVHIMPDFIPNENLFTKHKDKGSERWEVYGWAVRDAMIQCGGFDDCDLGVRHKIIYDNMFT